MDLRELITEDKILLLDSPPGDKIELLKQLLACCIKKTELLQHHEAIWETLLERENSMSTGIGLGVAIPHCSIEFTSEVLGALALLREGIDFQAVDDAPVKIIVLLLMPKNKFEKHIKTLALVARLLNDETFRTKILGTTTPAEAHEILLAELAPIKAADDGH